MRSESRFVFLILAGWLCVASIIGALGLFERASALVVAISVWSLTALLLVAGWKIRSLHDWAMTIDRRWLVLFHVIRFVGFYFLYLCGRNQLSCDFAYLAGFGDIFVAATALLLLAVAADRTLRGSLALRRFYRILLMVWNTIGLIDIVVVVFTALRVGLKDWPSMAPLRVLPLSLLPTFLVPLIIASHILIFVRLRSRRGVQVRGKLMKRQDASTTD